MTSPMAATETLSTEPLVRRPLSELISSERKRRARRQVVVWVMALLVPAVSGAAWLVLRPKPVPLAARFRLEPVGRADVVREVHATGHVEAETTVQVGAEISGRIATVEVDYNSRVKAGQVLARIDRAALEAQLAQSRANLAAARATLEQTKTDRDQSERNRIRAQNLRAHGLVSEGDYENTQNLARLADQRVRAAAAEVEAQAAAYSLATTTRDRTVIRSPIDGIVVTRSVDPGQTVASAFMTPVLFSVAANLERMRVVAAVDEADIGETARGQRGLFTVTAYPSRTFEGVVTEVRNSPVVVQDVVTYGAVVEVDNHDLALKPGMTASVRIVTATAKGALTVPSSALRFTPPGETEHDSSVWTLSGERFVRVDVRLGITNGEVTEIAPGSIDVSGKVIVDLTPAGKKAYGGSR